MQPCHRRCPGPAGPLAHSLRPEPSAPHDEPDFSTGCSPWPHPYDRPHSPDHHYSQLHFIPIPVILTAQILTSPAIPTPSRFTSPKTQQQLSRPPEIARDAPCLLGFAI